MLIGIRVESHEPDWHGVESPELSHESESSYPEKKSVDHSFLILSKVDLDRLPPWSSSITEMCGRDC